MTSSYTYFLCLKEFSKLNKYINGLILQYVTVCNSRFSACYPNMAVTKFRQRDHFMLTCHVIVVLNVAMTRSARGR